MASAPLPEAARRNVRAVRELEAEADRRRTRADRLTDIVSRFAGSYPFLLCQAVVISAWIGANVALDRSDRALDPFPFDFLTLLLDIEAILLSTFVLMTQGRQSREAERRGQVHLQVALLAEQEATKMLEMLRAICGRLGLDQVANDPELAQMIAATHVGELARELVRAQEQGPGDGDAPSAVPKPGTTGPQG